MQSQGEQDFVLFMCSCSVNHFFDYIIVSPWSFTLQHFEKEK
jgi:hypothetical protein